MFWPPPVSVVASLATPVTASYDSASMRDRASRGAAGGAVVVLIGTVVVGAVVVEVVDEGVNTRT